MIMQSRNLITPVATFLIVAGMLGGVSAAHAQPGVSCDALHPCTQAGYSCNANNICEADSGGSGASQAAQQNGSGQNVTLVNPLGAGTSLPILLTDILQFFVKIGAVVVVFMLVYIGFLFVTAQGEPGKITKAREALMWTIVGALILLGAEAIAQGISATVQALSVGG